MANSPNQRMKLLYLMKIMLEKSDADNPLTISEIITALSAYDIKAERKSIYTDMDLLRQFGIDIEIQRGKSFGYYVAERQFELPELKLLVDAVQSCRFITSAKSDDLIKKISLLTSNEQAKQLRRQVFVTERTKTINKEAYYSIDQIHYAINECKKISFKYFDYDVEKNRVYRKQGDLYYVSPLMLYWNDDKYYLITYSEKYGDFTHYRIDRMSSVSVLENKSDRYDEDNGNIAAHIKRVFGMYEGETVRARLAFDNSLVNVVIDHFGNDVKMFSSNDGWFEISVDISVSPVFLAWIFTFGDYAEIKAPDSLIESMKDLIEQNRSRYFTT